MSDESGLAEVLDDPVRAEQVSLQGRAAVEADSRGDLGRGCMGLGQGRSGTSKLCVMHR